MTFEDICKVKGEHFLKRYKYIPSEYILRNYYNGRQGEIAEFFVANRDEVLERAKSGYILPAREEKIPGDCVKIRYMSREVANSEMKRIQQFIQHNHKPVRSYHCTRCSQWHLTSQSNEIMEEYEGAE